MLEFLATEPEKKARADWAAQAGPQGLPGETLATASDELLRRALEKTGPGSIPGNSGRWSVGTIGLFLNCLFPPNWV
jgi:hypothetical protein